MDVGSVLLLIIVTACVVTLIVIAQKGNEPEESPPYGAYPIGEPIANNLIVEEKVEAQGPSQITIYEYCYTSRKCLCPLCDAENDVFAAQCRVCGQRLN